MTSDMCLLSVRCPYWRSLHCCRSQVTVVVEYFMGASWNVALPRTIPGVLGSSGIVSAGKSSEGLIALLASGVGFPLHPPDEVTCLKYIPGTVSDLPPTQRVLSIRCPIS